MLEGLMSGSLGPGGFCPRVTSVRGGLRISVR